MNDIVDCMRFLSLPKMEILFATVIQLKIFSINWKMGKKIFLDIIQEG